MKLTSDQKWFLYKLPVTTYLYFYSDFFKERCDNQFIRIHFELDAIIVEGTCYLIILFFMMMFFCVEWLCIGIYRIIEFIVTVPLKIIYCCCILVNNEVMFGEIRSICGLIVVIITFLRNKMIKYLKSSHLKSENNEIVIDGVGGSLIVFDSTIYDSD